MRDSKREFIVDFLKGYPDKEILKEFILNKLPLSASDKKFLLVKYCDPRYPEGTTNKVVAFNLGYSDRYVMELHNNIISRALPYFNLFFIKALETSL